MEDATPFGKSEQEGYIHQLGCATTKLRLRLEIIYVDYDLNYVVRRRLPLIIQSSKIKVSLQTST